MTYLKNLLKFIIPPQLINYRRLYKSKPIINFHKSKNDKNALLSYIITPFKNSYHSHTNSFEAQSWAKILSELGYNVDIINYDYEKNINLSKYDLICGFGDVFQHYFENGYKNAKLIYYGAGMHVNHQNHTTLARVKDVYHKKGVWLGKSARFVEKNWTHQTLLSDGIIALGNEICAKSYQKFYTGKTFSVPAPFYQTQNAKDIIKRRKPEANKHFLWFGSSGLIHKGLDLVLDYFKNNPEYTLHVCGPIETEPDFMNAYRQELFHTNNIICHGFVNIKSDDFLQILENCSFTIFPSCSEGGCASVITTIGNGGLIPIITKETTISTGSEIWIEHLDELGVKNAIKKALCLSNEEVKILQNKNLDFIINNNSQEKYFNILKSAIVKIISV